MTRRREEKIRKFLQGVLNATHDELDGLEADDFIPDEVRRVAELHKHTDPDGVVSAVESIKAGVPTADTGGESGKKRGQRVRAVFDDAGRRIDYGLQHPRTHGIGAVASMIGLIILAIVLALILGLRGRMKTVEANNVTVTSAIAGMRTDVGNMAKAVTDVRKAVYATDPDTGRESSIFDAVVNHDSQIKGLLKGVATTDQLTKVETNLSKLIRQRALQRDMAELLKRTAQGTPAAASGTKPGDITPATRADLEKAKSELLKAIGGSKPKVSGTVFDPNAPAGVRIGRPRI